MAVVMNRRRKANGDCCNDKIPIDYEHEEITTLYFTF